MSGACYLFHYKELLMLWFFCETLFLLPLLVAAATPNEDVLLYVLIVVIIFWKAKCGGKIGSAGKRMQRQFSLAFSSWWRGIGCSFFIQSSITIVSCRNIANFSVTCSLQKLLPSYHHSCGYFPFFGGWGSKRCFSMPFVWFCWVYSYNSKIQFYNFLWKFKFLVKT